MLPQRCWSSRRIVLSGYRTKRLCLFTSVSLSVCILLRSFSDLKRTYTPVDSLTEEHVQCARGIGGRWCVPSSWLDQMDAHLMEHTLTANSSILEAVEYAFELALHQHAFLNNSRIPLITHQTWVTVDMDAWPAVMKERVETWIRTAVQGGLDSLYGPEMAWFLWDDDGIDKLFEKYEPDSYKYFQQLPYPVEKADVFRVVVLKWFGGVYADVDSQPLKHPFGWIYNSDLLPWVDVSSGKIHTLHKPRRQAYNRTGGGPISYQDIFSSGTFNTDSMLQPSVNAIFGIEADSPPSPDPTYWRMGYTFAVQITNWALAMSPQHPVAHQFIHTLKSTISQNRGNLLAVDPLSITGPPALTAAIRTIAKLNEPEFSWNALSAHYGDPKGGRGKIIAGDVLILPITGFNPGRGWYQNMGSKSITHINARLRHAAAGSWRKMSLRVEFGKLCRVLFGLCREWKKIP